MSARALVVSIHDVSPLTREAASAILADLAGIGIHRTSLLVIPDHHHRGNITADPVFGAWLRDQVAAGHEPVLHGYFHQRSRHDGETARTRFMTRFYTADEGEFFDIDYSAARDLLIRGRDELAQCAGAVPTGFIAPAWLLSADGELAARDLGFAYTTRLSTFSSLAARRVHHSQSLCWSVRSPWRRTVSLGWNQLLFDSLKANPLLRISIHPPDRNYPAVWRQICKLARRVMEDRTPIPYGGFFP